MATATLLLAAALALNAAAVPLVPRQQDNGYISYANITASKDLKWVNCGAKPFQCAKLTVPLDYNNTSAGTVDIAYIRYFVSEDNEDIMYNPGGPGGSGVDSLVDFGASWAKRWQGYNLVSFDPRGVGRSGPILDCKFPNTSKRKLYNIGDLKAVYNDAVQNNQYCYDNTKDAGAKYVGTLANVQDIMHFTELQAGLRKKDPSKALVNYYGISYGTLMGQTLVATYPDRLRRVLLDGNVYGVGYYQGWEPSGSDDYGHGIWLLANACYQAGPKWCSLADGANSTDAVKAQIDYVVDILRTAPRKQQDGSPYTIANFLNQMTGPLMRPRSEYVKGINTTELVLDQIAAQIGHQKRDVILPDEDPDMRAAKWPANTQVPAIDYAGRYPWKTYDDWHAAAQRMDDSNSYGYGSFATSWGLFGAGQTVMPPKSQTFPGFKPIKPSANVMFINTSGDPVTPAASCRNMNKLFAGSGIVIVEGPGHGYEAAPSKCAYQWVDNYWKTGNVPPQEVTCYMDVKSDYFFSGATPGWLMALK